LDAEILAYLRAGIDGFFTDNADLGFKAREAFIQ
jgi:glycerophosphoryl diester phosphodiesterase